MAWGAGFSHGYIEIGLPTRASSELPKMTLIKLPLFDCARSSAKVAVYTLFGIRYILAFRYKIIGEN